MGRKKRLSHGGLAQSVGHEASLFGEASILCYRNGSSGASRAKPSYVNTPRGRVSARAPVDVRGQQIYSGRPDGSRRWGR